MFFLSRNRYNITQYYIYGRNNYIATSLKIALIKETHVSKRITHYSSYIVRLPPHFLNEKSVNSPVAPALTQHLVKFATFSKEWCHSNLICSYDFMLMRTAFERMR